MITIRSLGEGTMVRELQLAQRRHQDETTLHIADLQVNPLGQNQSQNLITCEHRTVSKDGRIVCSKIVEGDNEVSPNVCRSCPFKRVNCEHLRFSLCQASSSPLIVRFNGRTEVWDDEPPELRFERAACTAKVSPVHEPLSCSACSLRQPIQPVFQEPKRRQKVAGLGKVVPFPSHEKLAAVG